MERIKTTSSGPSIPCAGCGRSITPSLVTVDGCYCPACRLRVKADRLLEEKMARKEAKLKENSEEEIDVVKLKKKKIEIKDKINVIMKKEKYSDELDIKVGKKVDKELLDGKVSCRCGSKQFRIYNIKGEMSSKICCCVECMKVISIIEL